MVNKTINDLKSKRLSVPQLSIKQKFSKPKIRKSKRNDNAANTQRKIILRWFGETSSRLSTLEGREILGIMSPASRILELKQMGHKIVLEWERQRDNSGQIHDVGVYVYLGFSKEVVND